MSDVILKVNNLSVTLKGEKVIENLSFEVKRGDVVTILGPNGAGKTVLFNTLIGMFPYDGEIQWNERVKIGYVPQRVPDVKGAPISVEDFFKLKESDRSKIKDMLNAVGFTANDLHKKVGDLSAGQFQRVLIAWALIGEPDVLLLDEPIAGVDMRSETTIYNLLLHLREKRGLTMLWITHDLSVVYKFSNMVVCLNRCPICKGEPREVLTPQTLFKIYGQEVKFYEHHRH